jgi:hypothetical protein
MDAYLCSPDWLAWLAEEVPTLLELSIGSNNITRLPAVATNAFPLLSLLDLGGNFITSLSPAFFASIPMLSKVCFRLGDKETGNENKK